MTEILHALAFLRLCVATSPAADAAEQPRKRRKLKPRRKPYAGLVSINPGAPILSQLRGSMHG